MSSNLIRLNPSKTEFIVIGLPAQIKKIPDPSIHLSNNSSSITFTSDAPFGNLGVTFDPHLTFSNHISNLSRSCFMHMMQHIRDFRRIRPMLDSKTASTVATSIVHSKLDYCNSLFLNLDSNQIHRIQKFTRTGCYQNTQASSYHSCPEITSLAKNPRAHPLQSPVPNLQFPAVLPAHVPSPTLHHPAKPLYSIIILPHPFSTPGHFSSNVLQPSHLHHC